MLFRVCEHYEPIYQEYSEKECFICFDVNTSDGMKTIKLADQKYYFKNCVCDGPVHNECLKIWFDANSSCPICRIKMIKTNQNIIIVFDYFSYCIAVYYYIKNVTIRLVKSAILALLFNLLIFYYFKAISMRNMREYDDYTYSPISN